MKGYTLILQRALNILVLCLAVGIFSACSQTPTPITTNNGSTQVTLSSSQTDLSITQGEKKSMFLDITGTNAKSFSFTALVFQVDNPDLQSSVSIKLKTPQEKLFCIDTLVSSFTCINEGVPAAEFEFKDLELEFSVPVTQEVGTWDLSFMMAGWNTEVPDISSQNSIVFSTQKLTIVEAPVALNAKKDLIK